MGGELAVESELGRGSTFRITIPNVKVVEETAASSMPPYLGDGRAVSMKPPSANASPFPIPRSPKRVLVIDDSPVNRSVLTAHLKGAGVVSIDKACDGAEALSKLDLAVKDGNPHDIVFTDFWMPNMNGLELIEKVRADARFRRIPVFLVTADTEFQKDKRTELFDGILLKPLTHDKLMEVFVRNRDFASNT
jgi:CheY-like chemotaxis protein